MSRACFVCAKFFTEIQAIRCPDCKNVAYCSQECQQGHHKEHQTVCRSRQMQGEVSKSAANLRLDIMNSIKTVKFLRDCLSYLIGDAFVPGFFLATPLDALSHLVEVTCLERSKLPSNVFPKTPVPNFHFIGWSSGNGNTDVSGLGSSKTLLVGEGRKQEYIAAIDMLVGSEIRLAFLTGKVGLVFSSHPVIVTFPVTEATYRKFA